MFFSYENINSFFFNPILILSSLSVLSNAIALKLIARLILILTSLQKKQTLKTTCPLVGRRYKIKLKLFPCSKFSLSRVTCYLTIHVNNCTSLRWKQLVEIARGHLG